MTQLLQKPVIHGRDHLHGGPDPAMVAYEDVGSSGGGAGTGDPWTRHVVFRAASVVSAAGTTCFSWVATPAAVYDPDGEVASRDATLTHVLNLLSTGSFLLTAQTYFQGSSTGAHAVFVGFGSGLAAALSVVPFMVDPSDSSSAIAAGTVVDNFRVNTLPASVYLAANPVLAGAKEATLTVEKLGP